MPRALLLGLDGGTFDLLDLLMRQGQMPALARLIDEGTRAQLLSTPNPLTPPAWTSVMTGKQPGNHGVFDFVRISDAAERPRYTIATFNDIRAETIWSIASRGGRRVTSLNFPVMFPPPTVNGYVIPGFIPSRHLRRFMRPQHLYDRLIQEPWFEPDQLLLDLDLEREALQVLDRKRYPDWIRLHLRREAQWAAIATHLLSEGTCELTAVLFDGMDKLQHLCWRFLEGGRFESDGSPWATTVRDLCLQYYRVIDRFIGQARDLLGPNGHVLVVSDHGFGPTGEIFYVNAWLHAQGLLEWAPGVDPDRQGKQMTPGHRNPVVLFDWDKTTAYALTAGSNGIYIRVAPHPGTPGVAPADYEGFRAWLSDALLAFRDPVGGEQVVVAALPREQAFPGRWTGDAPDLTLQLRDGGFVSILNSDVVLRPRKSVMGTHRHEGIFVSQGPGIRRHATIGPLSITDVAPILLVCLGLPIPADFDGAVPADLFEESSLQRLGLSPGTAGTDPSAGAPVSSSPNPDAQLDPEGEAQIIDRLAALGYIE